MHCYTWITPTVSARQQRDMADTYDVLCRDYGRFAELLLRFALWLAVRCR